MKKRILAISLSVAVLLVSLTVAGMLTVTADTTIDWANGTWTNDPNLKYLDGTLHVDRGQIAPVEPGTYNASENLIYGDATNQAVVTDGLLFGDEGFTGYNYQTMPGYFAQNTYDLGAETTIGRFLVGGGTFGIPMIKVYASLTDSTPGDDEANLVVAMAGPNKVANATNKAFWLRPENEVKARYVTFSIYSPSRDDNNTIKYAYNGYGSTNSWQVWVGEFGIFGSKVIKNVEEAAPSVTTKDALSDDMKYVIDNNILTADKLASCHNYAGTYKPAPATIGNLFDGNVFNEDVSIAFTDDASADEAYRAVWYDFNLGEDTQISSLVIAAGQNFGVEGFDVYVVDTIAADIIANPGNHTPVYSYTGRLGTNNNTYWPSSPRNASAVLVEFGELPVGSHLIVKFKSSLSSGKWTVANLSEIAVVGGVSPIENKGAQVRANDGTLADLRFVFELNASGVDFGEGVYRTIADDAKVCIDGKIYTLKGYGAVVSLDGDAIAADAPLTNDAVKEVEAEKLYEVKTENKEVIYTVVVTGVPEFDKNIYARAYVDYQNGNDTIRVYDEVQVKTVDGVEAAAANDGGVGDAEAAPEEG